ncbi:hypothetical protein [Amphiplicatus metriothermophilus]|uniref:TonB C-terminal domain-containing protein n=1 Tax=Amphiplicatus metriothermophilus TaxID=1519374 RepID=A0A239PKG0_9PROT|nr:hypothetical protein [Amphiplicatus metriothermophilus]MBB5517379.1 hypothetical protein [Amphiplicatus metriothermophilus]SNT68286.1 hypothetical protein SAMN06297382_0787 [Amphiplicatus metriothermophilus]
MKTILKTVLIAACVLAPARTGAEPACADVENRLIAETAARSAPKTLETIEIGEAVVALSVVGRTGHADTALYRDHIRESQAMDAFLPGYPQPAVATFHLSVSF